MLLGRAAERARVQELLARARVGASTALLIVGEPGVGKTALLNDAVAAADGMVVLQAHGTDSAPELPFAALADLLAPVFDRRDRLPAAQAAALEAAFGYDRPASVDRFTAYVGALSLLATAAEAVPVLAVVDDLHWIDEPSREALAFVVRRLEAEGVVVLLTMRPGDAAGEHGWDRDWADVARMRLDGLDLAAAGGVLARRGEVTVAPAVLARLHAETRGNPLALLEVAAMLTTEQRAGLAPIEDPLPVGAEIERAFGRRIRALSEGTRRALGLCATSRTGAMDEMRAALAAWGLTRQDLEPAERAELITIVDMTVAFRHPLLRSVAYRSMPAHDRRQAHRHLSAVVVGDRAEERRAWHRAAASEAPDDMVAAALERAAEAARARGAPASAAVAGERAARLTSDPERQAQRLLRVAEDLAHVAGPQRAQALLGEALALTVDPILRADIQHLRGLVEERAGHAADAAQLLVEEASRVAAHDRRRAAAMTIAAVQPYFEAGRPAAGLATAERAWQLGAPVGLTPMPAGLPLAMALLLCGERRRAVPLLQQAASWLAATPDPWQLGPILYYGLGQAFSWLGDYDRASAILGTGIRRARESSAPALLPYGLLSQAELLLRTGRWMSAYATASEAADLAEQTGQLNDQAYALAILARVEAGMGHERACRRRLVTVNRLIDLFGMEVLRSYVAAVLGFLELGLGSREAITALEELARFHAARPVTDPEVLQSGPDLVEAYARAGRRSDAETALAEFAEAADRSGSRWALSTVARCRGMLASDGAFAEHFTRALATCDTPFETARTQLCLGERLLRAGRRVQARENLTAAARTFDRLGARPWADRALSELGVSSGRPRRDRSAAERLTPRELQVALTIADGVSNQAAAATLFLSTKTIEFHLRNIYRKLGVGSRTELVRAIVLADHPRPGTPGRPDGAR